MKYSILLVEDEDDMRSYVGDLLKGRGFYVVPVANADTALYLMAEQVKFDLLFTDIVIPGEMNGFRLADRATRLQPGIKILYTTGFAEVASEPPKELYGRLIMKPYRAAEVEREIWLTLEDRPCRSLPSLC